MPLQGPRVQSLVREIRSQRCISPPPPLKKENFGRPALPGHPWTDLTLLHVSSSQVYPSALPQQVHGVGLPAQIAGAGAGAAGWGELGAEETWGGGGVSLIHRQLC